MSFIKVLILGIIQGITEFLPISSSGHLLLFENIFGFDNGDVFFNVLLHFGSLVAVVMIFWKDIVEIIKKPFSSLTKNIVYATIPTVIIALLFNYFIDECQLNSFLGYGFLISAIIIFVSCKKEKKVKNKLIEINGKSSFFIGFVQGVAVLPGISRSGSTISCGLMLGLNRDDSARFSFLISIPIIFGAMLFKFGEISQVGVDSYHCILYLTGFIVSFITSLISIKIMMKVVKNGNWIWFSVYLFLLSIFVLLNQYVLCLF